MGSLHGRPDGRGLPAAFDGRPAEAHPFAREILYSQVYVSFQHDVSGVTAMTASGYRNVAWGSDYPHHEGTFGHTQEVLHGLFDDVDPSVRRRITVEAFQELFPTVAPAPIDADGRLLAT